MAVNRFDTPAQYNPIDTYVPLPLQQLMGAVEYKQKQGEVAEDALLKLGETQLGETLKQIDRPGFGRTDVGDISKANLASSKMQEFNARVSDLSSRGIDPADPMYRREIKKLGSEMRQFFSAEGVGGEAMQRAKEYRQLEAALAKAEIGDQPWLANPIRKELDRFIKEGGPINLGVSAIKDVDMGLLSDRLVSGLSADVKDITTAQVGPNGEIVYTSTGRKEITEDRIRNTAYGLINNSDAANKLNAIEEHYRDLARETGATAEEAAKIGLAQREKHYKQIEDSLVAKYKLLATQDKVQITGSGSNGNNTDFSLNSVIEDEIVASQNPDPFGVYTELNKSGVSKVAKLTGRFFRDFFKSNSVREDYKQEVLAKRNEALDNYANKFNLAIPYKTEGLTSVPDYDELMKSYDETMEGLKSNSGKILTFKQGDTSKYLHKYIGTVAGDQTIENHRTGEVFTLNNKEGKNYIEETTGWDLEEFKTELSKLRGTGHSDFIYLKGIPTNAQAGSVRLMVPNRTGKKGKGLDIPLNMVLDNTFQNQMKIPQMLGQAYSRGISTEELYPENGGFIPTYYDTKTGKLLHLRMIPRSEKKGDKYEYVIDFWKWDGEGQPIKISESEGISYIENAFSSTIAGANKLGQFQMK